MDKKDNDLELLGELEVDFGNQNSANNNMIQRYSKSKLSDPNHINETIERYNYLL